MSSRCAHNAFDYLEVVSFKCYSILCYTIVYCRYLFMILINYNSNKISLGYNVKMYCKTCAAMFNELQFSDWLINGMNV